MASLPANDRDLLMQDALPDYVLVRTDQIDRGDRLRPVDRVWAEALGQIMLREGQRTPIEVCRLPGANSFTLVTGGHRHAAAGLAGIVHLKAEIVSADRDDRRMREVSENLWRKDLDPIDRAAFVAEAVSIHKRRAGVAAAARRDASVPHAKAITAEAQDTLDTMSNVYGWTDEVGAELGFSGRTLRRDLYVYRRLAPSMIDRLRAERHPVVRNATQLRALAKLEPPVQRDVVDTLIGANGWEPAKTVAEAVRRTQPAATKATVPGDKRLSTFLGAFSRMTLAEKKGALEALQSQLPAGTTLTFGEAA